MTSIKIAAVVASTIVLSFVGDMLTPYDHPRKPLIQKCVTAWLGIGMCIILVTFAWGV